MIGPESVIAQNPRTNFSTGLLSVALIENNMIKNEEEMVYFILKNTLCDEGLKAGTLEAKLTQKQRHTLFT